MSLDRAGVWLVRPGFIGFGGPAGQIAILHGELVERRWMDETGMLRRNTEYREPVMIAALASGQRDPTIFFFIR